LDQSLYLVRRVPLSSRMRVLQALLQVNEVLVELEEHEVIVGRDITHLLGQLLNGIYPLVLF